MGIERSENWFLRKHDNGEVFGPVSFEKIREWTHSAQVNPQDVLSIDQVIWTKAPMIPELEMDWLVVVGQNLLYGPTTAEALLEFERRGEISFATALINCKTGQTITLHDAPFYQISQTDFPQAERTSMDILTRPTAPRRTKRQFAPESSTAHPRTRKCPPRQTSSACCGRRNRYPSREQNPRT